MAAAQNGRKEFQFAHQVKWADRAVLIVDVVEYVRLIEADEYNIISRWLGLVEHIKTQVLPNCEGRLVNCAGDGLLLEFPGVRGAISAAFEIQHASNRGNYGLPSDQQIHLRMGLEVGAVALDQLDVYGRGVNLAARLMTLAGPGEIIISARVRERLTPVVDADVEDLGECHLKHIQHPVRAFRIGPPGPRPIIKPGISAEELLPTLAVVPFAAIESDSDHQVLGEVLAEEMIRELSHTPELSVISRLSTTAFRGRDVTHSEIGSHLNADYVISGDYHVRDRRITLDIELAEAKSGRIVWIDRLEEQVSSILSDERELIGRVITHVSDAIMLRELQRTRSQALPTLKSYTLLMGAIALMHRLSLRDFEQAHRLLMALIERASRQSIPNAWLAKWYVLRVQQGWSSDPQKDGQVALGYTKRALDTDPDSSLALAIDGFVHTNLLKQFDVAQERYDLAIRINPSDPLAWLLRGTLHAFMGWGQRAVDDTQRALKLTPLDPHRYFYDSLAATACYVAHQYDDALSLAERSLRANRMHTSTLRVMAAAQWHLGLQQEARNTAHELLELEPNLTVGGWLARSPSADFDIGREFSRVLRQVGVPN